MLKMLNSHLARMLYSPMRAQHRWRCWVIIDQWHSSLFSWFSWVNVDLLTLCWTLSGLYQETIIRCQLDCLSFHFRLLSPSSLLTSSYIISSCSSLNSFNVLPPLLFLHPLLFLSHHLPSSSTLTLIFISYSYPLSSSSTSSISVVICIKRLENINHMPSSHCTIFKVIGSLLFSHCTTIWCIIQLLLCSHCTMDWQQEVSHCMTLQ